MLKAILNSPVKSGDQTILDGNLVIGTAGAGIDFSAAPHAAGMTSELLDDYEEGTWTPTDASGAGLVFSSVAGTYTKIGNCVRLTASFAYPSNADPSNTLIGGLPFTASGNAPLAFKNTSATVGDSALIVNTTALIYFYADSVIRKTNANYSSTDIYISGVYYV